MRILVIANWKSNPQALKEAKELFNLVKEGVQNTGNVEVVICPPFVFLSNVKCQMSNVKLGAQNCFFQSGPFTGEISPQMLKDLGCEYVIIGHSERRALGESDELINKKMKAVLEIGLKPILCIGETQEERNQGKTKEALNSQLKSALSGLEFKVCGSELCVAYEPVWAIGTGNPCSFDDAKKAKYLIEEILVGIWEESQAKDIPVLYGGSVNSKIAAGFLKESKMNGLLVGGASLDVKEFIKIIESLTES